jgi:GxxExxY protein
MSNSLGENLYERQLTDQIIGAAIEVHKSLGPGLLESAYLMCMARELDLRNIKFEKEFPLPVEYKGIKLNCGYRLDLLVEQKVIVELKSVEAIENVHKAQLLTYMKLIGCKVGILINFNVSLLKNGIVRLVL